MQTFIRYARTLSPELSSEVNRTGWNSTTETMAYADLGFTNNTTNIAPLVAIAARAGIYTPSDLYKIDDADHSAGMKPIDELHQIVMAKLEWIFAVGNGQGENKYTTRVKLVERSPSISVGDIIVLRGHNTMDIARAWIVANLGFIELFTATIAELNQIQVAGTLQISQAQYRATGWGKLNLMEAV
jgi:hypothetical protein